jgi:hypothetical protein
MILYDRRFVRTPGLRVVCALGRLTTKNRKKKKRKFRIKKTKQSGGKKWGKNFGCSARLPFGSSPVVSQGPPKVGEDLF